MLVWKTCWSSQFSLVYRAFLSNIFMVRLLYNAVYTLQALLGAFNDLSKNQITTTQGPF